MIKPVGDKPIPISIMVAALIAISNTDFAQGACYNDA